MRYRRSLSIKTSGFTLIEMAAVILIIGIMGATAVISLDRLTPRYRFRSEARNVAGFVEAARTAAIRSARHYTIIYDTKTGRYWAEPQWTPDSQADVPPPKIHELDKTIAFEKIELGGLPLGERVTVSVSAHGGIAVHAVHLRETGGIGRTCTVTFAGPGSGPMIEDGYVSLPEQDRMDEGLLRDRHEEYIRSKQ